ncbi:NAD(+) diphosphatase [Bifidobacterium avesanii]|uniref:NAD(+) diphosphatase n=2 Tax=Bifidobacterium avesanii TaxID=1798157 RepID=A0A7K3THL9_9BIFI|nr:NAD(+) diphosphatase [Bifidobacterium avesanii]
MGIQGFSPLSLTGVLPFLPLAQGDIDYQVDRRGQEGLIDEVLAEPTTRVLLVNAGKLAVPRGQAAVVDYEAAKMRLALLPGAYMADELATHPGAVPIFLGAYGPRTDAEHMVAVDITRAAKPVAVPPVPDAAGVGADDAFESVGAGQAPAGSATSIIDQAAQRFDWVDLRGFAPHASAREAGLATSAASLSMWHNSQRFCPCCGAPVAPALGGWAQRCTSPDDRGRILFPRIEPAVITAIVDRKDRLMVQHNAAWRNELLYSVSAGFVEAGENLEHAARREAREETGVRVGELRYLGSQPWPFPSSLMMAFKGQAETDEIRVDGKEVTDAAWMTRDEYTHALIAGRLEAPGRATIARYMIEEWLGREL